MASRTYVVYILANVSRTVLYTGITSDLRRRLAQHRAGEGSRFAKRYQAHDLVYVEAHANVNDAIAREKQIKSGSRRRKDALIASVNPELRDLSVDLALWP